MELDFVGMLHRSTSRDYIARVTEHDKAECAAVAKQFGRNYWDGERHHGYGGYHYDGRWRSVADAMAAHYGIKSGDRILDVGCGKGYLLYEFTQSVPGVEITGIDISEYAVENAKPEVREYLQVGDARVLPWEDGAFDFVVSLGTFHNLPIFDLYHAVREFERVGRADKYIMVESWRDERQKANLLYWQLTCETFFSTKEWEWFYNDAGYAGDYGYIYFD